MSRYVQRQLFMSRIQEELMKQLQKGQVIGTLIVEFIQKKEEKNMRQNKPWLNSVNPNASSFSNNSPSNSPKQVFE